MSTLLAPVARDTTTRYVALDHAPYYGEVFRVDEWCSDATSACLRSLVGSGTVVTSWERCRPVAEAVDGCCVECGGALGEDVSVREPRFGEDVHLECPEVVS